MQGDDESSGVSAADARASAAVARTSGSPADRVIQLNDELDADLQHRCVINMARSPPARASKCPTLSGQEVAFQHGRRGPQPVKERELRYKEDYSQNHEASYCSGKKRLHALSND
ncbi:hypothetical protein GWK47_052015 [Chionoecetes opilio]|uniref:Uncharacterized protein n=1 Tax=Chionoecetes opilio TaxID=41210 RepID=A0A8J4Y9B8_CHIOP|nr:hypothetical protein GWK47_052015 [Chionoecetes opilio]